MNWADGQNKKKRRKIRSIFLCISFLVWLFHTEPKIQFIRKVDSKHTIKFLNTHQNHQKSSTEKRMYINYNIYRKSEEEKKNWFSCSLREWRAAARTQPKRWQVRVCQCPNKHPTDYSVPQPRPAHYWTDANVLHWSNILWRYRKNARRYSSIL